MIAEILTLYLILTTIRTHRSNTITRERVISLLEISPTKTHIYLPLLTSITNYGSVISFMSSVKYNFNLKLDN